MGLFDWVDHPEILCPLCKDAEGKLWNRVGGWQTKDGDCDLEVLRFPLPPGVVEFYASCDLPPERRYGGGDHWIEARRDGERWRWYARLALRCDDWSRASDEFEPVMVHEVEADD